MGHLPSRVGPATELGRKPGEKKSQSNPAGLAWKHRPTGLLDGVGGAGGTQQMPEGETLRAQEGTVLGVQRFGRRVRRNEARRPSL